MLKPGIYPAAVTPMNDRGEIDLPGLARLLAHFESKGCTGVVLAGTNGEGPSLAAAEKRDMLRGMAPVKGKLDLVLGVATASLSEAIWSCQQASKAGAVAALVMPTAYFREASRDGLLDWYRRLLDEARLPILAYNFPTRTGITLDADFLARLNDHPNFVGAKDSSGERANLRAYADALPGMNLFVGAEPLLLDALQAGWTGSISGAANSVAAWLCQACQLWREGEEDQAKVKFSLILPILETLRRQPQPMIHKAVLHRLGIIDDAAVRLPLASGALSDELWDQLRAFAQA